MTYGLLDRLRGPGRPARSRRARLRRFTAALAAVIAVWTLWGLLRPTAPAGMPVTVAARQIGAGTRITAADLRTERWPAGIRIPGLLSAATASGGTAVTAIAPGEPVTGTRVVQSTWAALRPDEQAFTVPLIDSALARLLSPGDRIDLYDPGDRRLVVSAARVVISTTEKVVPMGSEADGASILVVAVPRQRSAELAGSLASAATLGTGLVAAARPVE